MPRHSPLFWPPHAYIPGQTARHADGYFDEISDSVHGQDAITDTAAWQAGLAYLDAGYFWECHEVLEAVWMSLPHGTDERALVQALIQLANARLKLRMNRPRATARLCAIVEALLAPLPPVVMGQSCTELRAQVVKLVAG